jgi:hypothetical protein
VEGSFTTVFARVRHLSLSTASWIQSICCQQIFLISILLLFSHLHLGLPSGLFRSRFSTNSFYTILFLLSRSVSQFPIHLFLLDFIILVIFGRYCTSTKLIYTSLSCNLFPCFVCLFVYLTFKFLDNGWEDRRLWTEWQQAFPEFSLLLISSCTQFWSFSVVPRYLNLVTSSKDPFIIFMPCFVLSSAYVTIKNAYFPWIHL